mgnify:CR=1 FL=1
MCGRYTLFTDQENQEIINIINAVNEKYKGQEIKTGEIFPTNLAPVLFETAQEIAPAPMKWGFPNFRSKSGVIINARAETAMDKPTFRDAVFTGRCVVPSTGFYEWNKEKKKYRFNLPNEKVLYMAGLFKEYDGERKFVILTTAPNNSMSDVHNRMPVVLRKQQIKDWLSDTQYAVSALAETPPELVRAIEI